MKRARLIVAASESSADMLYATRFRAPDPFVFLETRGRRILLLTDLEIDRGRREARVDEVHSYSDFEAALQGTREQRPAFASVLAAFLRSRNVKRVAVPSDFPLGLARALKKEKIRARPQEGSFFPERMIKRRAEISALKAALRITETGMARGHEVLRAARPRRDGRLWWGRQLLTSERLRREIEMAVVGAGGEARGDTIVACGEHACDPHERGRGPLRANQLIIMDIFPRAAASGYFGDLTRTVVRGTASDEQRRLWETCLAGQQQAIEAVRPRANGAEVHERVKAFFAEQGYPTEIAEGRWRGFFHGTGHGLGLEIHEAPRFAAARFRSGQVFTVEPGIYWPGVGGVRHEDVGVVVPRGFRLLSRFPKTLEL